MQDTKDAPWGSVETEFYPIHCAARQRDAAAIREQLALGVDVDLLNGRARNGDGGNTALWFAAQGPWPNGIEGVRLLVESGAQINRQCEHGRTALHIAAAWGHLDVITFLIDSGADATIRDDEGMTPAMVARKGYCGNRVKIEERRVVREHLEARGLG